MKEKLRKLKVKLQIIWKNSLIRKNIKLKGEIRKLKEQLEETRRQNHKLIDEKTLDNIRIRELSLEIKNANNNI